MKPIDARIAYYLKKVSQYGSVHSSKRKNQYRNQRLLNYQKAMHELVEENAK